MTLALIRTRQGSPGDFHEELSSNSFLLVGRGRQPSSPLGLGHKNPKNPKKIRCKCATVARYSMPYRFLYNDATSRHSTGKERSVHE